MRIEKLYLYPVVKQLSVQILDIAIRLSKKMDWSSSDTIQVKKRDRRTRSTAPVLHSIFKDLNKLNKDPNLKIFLENAYNDVFPHRVLFATDTLEYNKMKIKLTVSTKTLLDISKFLEEIVKSESNINSFQDFKGIEFWSELSNTHQDQLIGLYIKQQEEYNELDANEKIQLSRTIALQRAMGKLTNETVSVTDFSINFISCIYFDPEQRLYLSVED